MLRFFKKGTSRKSREESITPKVSTSSGAKGRISRISSTFATRKKQEKSPGHVRKASSESLQCGPSTTLSSTTGSSEFSFGTGHLSLLHVSSSATTKLRHNGGGGEVAEQQTLPMSRPGEASRLKPEALMQLARKKANEMRNVSARANVSSDRKELANLPEDDCTAMSTNVVPKDNTSDAFAADDLSLSANVPPKDDTCDAFAANDLIQSGMAVYTCGLVQNFRPISVSNRDDGSCASDENGYYVLDDAGTVRSHSSKSTQLTLTSEKSVVRGRYGYYTII